MTNTPYSRRQFITSTLAGSAALSLTPHCLLCAENTRYEGLDSAAYLGEAVTETTIKDTEIFTEGPAVDRAGLVYFTNVPMSKILRWDPVKKQLSVFRENSNKANGLLFEPDGSLLACEGGAGRVTRTDMKTGKISVLASRYNGFPLAAPNDLVRDRKGRIYFTSRPGVKDPTKGNVNAVYRIDPDGKLTQILALPAVHMPNGIVLSPDEKTLYLIEADGGKDRNRHMKAYDVTDDGALTNPRVLIDFSPGRSGDGMCIDSQGNLYVAAGLHKTRGSSETLDTKPGIHVISPQGKLLAYRQTPVDTITNCTFGGKDLKTLYVTCGPYLISIRTKLAGRETYRPQQ